MKNLKKIVKAKPYLPIVVVGVLVVALGVALLISRVAEAADTSWFGPSADANLNPTVTNPTNAYTDNGSNAIFNDTADHKYGGFGISVPDGSTVLGIKVEIQACSSSGDKNLDIYISDNNGVSWGSDKDANNFDLNCETRTVGGSNDKWGRADWTTSELSNTNFAVRIKNDFSSGTVGVDYVAVKVYYGGYHFSLTSPTPPTQTDTFTWTLSGEKPGSGQEISHFSLQGCWGEDDIESVSIDENGPNETDNWQWTAISPPGGEEAIKINNLNDDSDLPATITVVFNQSYLSNGSVTGWIKQGSNLVSYGADGPNCDTPREATIIASKVVCDYESNPEHPNWALPNWGDHGATIGASTASDYVANSNGKCHLETNWDFQWAYDYQSNPGNNEGEQSNPWNTFTNTTQINNLNNDKIWLREVWNNQYIPFSGDYTKPYDTVSAEFYCQGDVLNYDNYEWINNLQHGQTYYCVAFNALSTGSLKVNKLVDERWYGFEYNIGNDDANQMGFRWQVDSGAMNEMGSEISGLSAGSHPVNENGVTDYHFTGWFTNGSDHTCTNPEGTTLPINVTINGGQTTEITLCNSRDSGYVGMTKTVIPHYGWNEGPQWNFDLVGPVSMQWSLGDGHLGGTTVPTGQYTLSETPYSGVGDDVYDTTYRCYRVVEGPVDYFATGTGTSVTFTLEKDQRIECEFTNTELATIIVHKNVLASDHSTDVADNHTFSVTTNSETKNFSEDTTATFSVAPGTYDVVESPDLNYTFFRCETEFEPSEQITNGLNLTVSAGQTAEMTCINYQNTYDLHGYKWNDLDGNHNDNDGTEQKLSGWTIFIDANDNGQLDEGEKSMETCTEAQTQDSGHICYGHEVGWYWFEGLEAGTYKICEVLQNDWQQTYPVDPVCHTVTLPRGGLNDTCTVDAQPNAIVAFQTCNFGNQEIPKICGDGKKNQETEECDGTDGVGEHQACTNDCKLQTLPYCGDGVKNGDEACDGTDGVGANQTCTANCTIEGVPYCGDSIKNGTEECDGTEGITGSQTCSTDCKIVEPTPTTPQAEVVQPTMTLTKLDTPDPVAAGANLTYTLNFTIANASATNVTMTDEIPANTTFVSASDPGKYDATTNKVTWNYGNLAAGNYVATLKVKVYSPLANGTKISNTAIIDSNETDPVVTATAETATSTAPILTMDKLVDNATPTAGATINYTVKVTNSGTDTAKNVKLTDTLPAGLTFVDNGTATMTYSFGNIESGKTVATTYAVKIDSTIVAGTYTNKAELTADNHAKLTDSVDVAVSVPKVLGEETVQPAPVEEVKVLGVELPETGANALVMLLSGLALVGSGFILRRKVQ